MICVKITTWKGNAARKRAAFRLFFGKCLEDANCLLHILLLHQLDGTSIAHMRELGVDRKLFKHRKAVCLCERIDAALAVHGDLLSAIGADEIAHIFHEAEDRHVHQLCHIDRLFHDHGDQLLRAADDHDAVERQRLENGQRNVTRSGRHIDEHKVDVVPNDLAPELLDRACDDRAAPDDGLA